MFSVTCRNTATNKYYMREFYDNDDDVFSITKSVGDGPIHHNLQRFSF
jgi:hypothetical protein